MLFEGIGISDGIAVGKATILKERKISIVKRKIKNVQIEKDRFLICLENTKKEYQALMKLANINNEQKTILEAHIMLMSDSFLLDEIVKEICENNSNSEFAIEKVYDLYIKRFENMSDEAMKSKAVDLKDIKNKLLENFTNRNINKSINFHKNSIIIAKDLKPSIFNKANKEFINGIILEEGSENSHTSILAKSFSIPTIILCKNILSIARDNDDIYLDANDGKIYINPDNDFKIKFYDKKKKFDIEKEKLCLYKNKESIVTNGKKIKLMSNIGSLDELELATELSDGIGLFRTEILFMNRAVAPSCEEQFNIYKKLALSFKEKDVVIRTLDIGGDKEIKCLELPKEENPFLGYRAIRLCLGEYIEIFKIQLLAMLRASAFGNIKILLPFISCIDEIRQTKILIENLKRYLDEENIDYNHNIKLGIMVETPSAAIVLDMLLNEVDFISIGTNDLTQYIMSADRQNSRLEYLYSIYDPAVIRTINNIINIAHKENISVSMCGEAAGNDLLLPLFLSWGLEEFSMNTNSILRIKKRILELDMKKIDIVIKDILNKKTKEEVIAYLKDIC